MSQSVNARYPASKIRERVVEKNTHCQFLVFTYRRAHTISIVKMCFIVKNVLEEKRLCSAAHLESWHLGG